MAKNKGSRPQEELVPITRASRMIGVSTSTLHRMAKRGVLQPLFMAGSKLKYFRIHDVSALAETLQHGKERPLLDLESIAELSMQAVVLARANERRLDDLYHLLGLNKPTLEVSEEHIIALYVRAQEATKETRGLQAEDVYDWAGILYAVDESYLGRVQAHTACEEPWKVFMDLAHHLIERMPIGTLALNPSMKTAYAYLSTARNNLRSVSYYYCRQKLGISTASKVFRHADDPIEDVCRLMFPSMPDVFGAR
jgi:hypothetical protein